MLKGNPSGRSNAPGPAVNSQIINTVAGQLPLSARRLAQPRTHISQASIAKPSPRPPEVVRWSESISGEPLANPSHANTRVFLHTAYCMRQDPFFATPRMPSCPRTAHDGSECVVVDSERLAAHLKAIKSNFNQRDSGGRPNFQFGNKFRRADKEYVPSGQTATSIL